MFIRAILLALALFGFTASAAFAADSTPPPTAPDPVAALLPAAVHASPFTWRYFNAAPWAHTRDEGVATREDAFKCIGFTGDILKQIVDQTATAGTPTTIKNGDHFLAMVSKNPRSHACEVHYNVTVGWPTPAHGVAYVGSGEQRTVIADGYKIVLVRPDVCSNWSVASIERLPAPTPAAQPSAQPDNCVHLRVVYPAGAVFHQVTTGRRALIPGPCGRKVSFLVGHGRLLNCASPCIMDSSVQDLKDEGYLIQRLPGTELAIRCMTDTPCVLDIQYDPSVATRAQDVITLNCFSVDNGPVSLVKDIHWRSFKDGVAIIAFSPEQAAPFVPPHWGEHGGLVHVWQPAGPSSAPASVASTGNDSSQDDSDTQVLVNDLTAGG